MTTNDLWPRRRRAARAFVTEGMPKGVHTWADKPYAYDYETEKAMFLGWFDDNPKKTTADKIAEARAAYVTRMGAQPNVVLVNEEDRGVEVDGLTTRVENYIRRNIVWVGTE